MLLKGPILRCLLLFMAASLGSVIVGLPVSAQEVINWECRVEGNNNGCEKTVQAPVGKKIVGVTAACNLEYGAVSNRQLAAVPANTIKVVRESSDRRFGACYVGDTRITGGQVTINNGIINGVDEITVGCKEHDQNGGDCHIKGTLTLEDENGTAPSPAQEVISWECRVEGNNDGCETIAQAPAGKKIVGVTAACNLEYGAVSDRQLAAVPNNTIQVVRASDRRWRYPVGACYVGNTRVTSGQATINGINEVTQITVGCKEHDQNGGDCHIKGTLTLENSDLAPASISIIRP